MRKLLLGRRLVLSTLCAAIILMVLAQVIPQDAALIGDRPIDQALSWIGADHIYTSPVFRVIVLVLLLQLAVAVVHLGRRDWRRATRRECGSASDVFELHNAEKFLATLKRLGYRRLPEAEDGAIRYVRHRWGYAGPTFMHAGMLVAIAAIALVSVTRATGYVHLTEGEVFEAGEMPLVGESSLLGSSAVLGSDLTLVSVAPEYWDDGSLRSLESAILIEEDGTAVERRVAVNAPSSFDSVELYQTQDYGYSFFISLTDPAYGQRLIRIDLDQPFAPDTPSYADVPLPDGRILRSKCLADEIGGVPATIVLRLEADGVVVDQTDELGAGDAVRLSDLSVAVDAVGRWAGLSYVSSHGISALFVSYFVILAGALCIYLATPREVCIRKTEDGSSVVSWRSIRFSELYRREYLRLLMTSDDRHGAER